MSRDAQTLYEMFLDKYRETGERYVSICIPRSLKEHIGEYRNELEREGLIAKANIYGQQYISCVLTDDNLCIVHTKE